MRPLELTFAALGPFAGQQTLDFTALQGSSFFLIHGPTGAGKTTILDAICFALYGETSGGDREVKQMRCDLAEPGLATSVTFDFALGGTHYRVSRQAEHQRPKLRGEGTTTERARATLWRLQPDQPQRPSNPEVLASQWTRVTERVEEVLGFRCEQFRQVVMLPQGQFRRLLLANSRQRQQILEALFSTELYRRIEEALKEAARTLAEQGQLLEQRRRLLLQQEEVASEEELGERLQQLTTALERTGEQIEGLQRREELLQQRLTAARAAHQQLEERRRARRALELLEAQRAPMEAEGARAAQARAAAGIAGVHQGLLQRVEEQRQAREAQATAGLALESAQRELEQERAAQERERGRAGQLESLQRRKDELEAMQGRARDLDMARAALERACAAAEQARVERGRALDQLTRSRGSQEDAVRRRDEAHERNLGLPAASEAVLHLERAVSLTRRLQAGLADLGQARGAFESAQRELDRLEDELDGLRQELCRMEQSWAAGQAAVLAADLAEGTPCPVCGSTEHPTPAASGIQVPTQAELSRRRKQARAVETQREGARQELSVRNAEVIQLSAEVVTLKASLQLEETAEQRSVEREVERLEQELGQARGQCDAAAAARDELPRLQREVDQQVEEERRLTAALEQAEQVASEAERARARQEALEEERSQHVPVELREPGCLAQALSQACDELERIATAQRRAEARLQAASERLAGSGAAAQSASAAADRARQMAREARAAFEEQLRGASLEDEATFLGACLEPGDLLALERTIQRYGSELGAALERRERAEEACAQESPPASLDLLQRDLARLKDDLTSRLVKRGEREARIQRIEANLQELVRLGRSSATQDQRFQLLGQIAEVAGGSNAYRISFQRYVLAALLDDVLTAASRRLRVMSRGRYDLQRTRERTDLRRSGGLDLLVFDSHTGSERPVSTLSGGESFLAALSLALGLADTVQAYAGGVKLETIFIDEGFGSLDPESFELAFRALMDLQGGGRLVGVISHMPELKELIDLRVEVKPGLGGSTARFE